MWTFQVGARLLHTDGRTDRQTDRAKLTAAFSNCLVNAPISWRLPPPFRTPNLYVKPRMHKQIDFSISDGSHSWLQTKLWALTLTAWQIVGYYRLAGGCRRFGERYCFCLQGTRHKCSPLYKPKMLNDNGLLYRRIVNWTQNGEATYSMYYTN
jgi:hypothetical protein